jgi:hypothetical protein
MQAALRCQIIKDIPFHFVQLRYKRKQKNARPAVISRAGQAFSFEWIVFCKEEIMATSKAVIDYLGFLRSKIYRFLFCSSVPGLFPFC